MELTFEQIQSVAKGVAYITEEEQGIFFHRFTKEQEDLYERLKPWHFMLTKAPAGVKLLFKTNSRKLAMEFKTESGGSRQLFSLDVSVNGNIVGTVDNYDRENLVEDYVHGEYPLGEGECLFSLGEGVKTVCVHLPWSVTFCLKKIELDDGAMIEPVHIPKKLLAFGDSITQGYDAFKSKNRYIDKLCNALQAEEFNKAVGGANFFPELAATKDDFEPDYITVAYGTNDWSIREKDDFAGNCRKFYESLSQQYPQVKIFAITPIWRKDYETEQKMGPFTVVEETIRKVAEPLPNVQVIRGFDLVPGDVQYFADGKIHPNDEGFEFYFKNLYGEIKKYI